MNIAHKAFHALFSSPRSSPQSKIEGHNYNPIPDAAPSASAPTKFDSGRCQFTYSDGRRCRNDRAALCVHHGSKAPIRSGSASRANSHSLEGGAPSARRSCACCGASEGTLPSLQALCGDLTTATNVNRALTQVFLLMAQGRISQKQAVAFGYLTQLLLQTVPGVRAEYVAAYGYHPWEEKLKATLELTIRPGSSSRATNGSEGPLPGEPNSAPGAGGGESAEQPLTGVVEPKKGVGITPFFRHEKVERRISPDSAPQPEISPASKPINKARLSERSLREGLTPADYESLLHRGIDLMAGKYNATPEGRREAKAFALDLELMKPPDSKPPKGYFGEVVSLVRRLRAGKSPIRPGSASRATNRSEGPLRSAGCSPDIWFSGLGHPIKPPYEYPPESGASSCHPDPAKTAPPPGPPAPAAASTAANPRSPIQYAAPIAPALTPTSREFALPPANVASPSEPACVSSELPVSGPKTSAPMSQPRPRTRIRRNSLSSPPGSAAADPDDSDSDPLHRKGHTTEWYEPSAWSRTGAPDPFPSRREKLKRQFRSMSHSAFRRLQHQNSRGLWTEDLQKFAT